jgi:signal transduction histidine kinase/AmiR/NasT family two-component response regulator
LTGEVDVGSLAEANILIVEDEFIIAKDIEQSLRQIGYQVAGITGTGADAIRVARELRPDLILMDIQLRGSIDGIEAARQIRQESGVPVVFLTAYADDGTLARAREVAPYGYLLKPFATRELQIAIVMALAKHRVFSELDTVVRERTEQLVQSEIRFKQMAAINELGLFAIDSGEVEQVMEFAARIAASTLELHQAHVMELAPDGKALRLRTGFGLEDDVARDAVFAADDSSQEGSALCTEQPVVVEDANGLPSLLAGASAGICVIIHSPGPADNPYGIFAAHARQRHRFSAYDVQFLQVLAHIIGASIDRDRAETERRTAQLAADREHLRLLQAEEAVRVRDEFLAIAAHEFRTPLTALQLRLESLAREAEEISPAASSKLVAALKSTHRLANLVETVLDVSRIALGRLALKIEPFDLADAVQETMDQLASAAAEASCELHLKAGDPGRGRWDRARLEQVVTNLLSNAIKYGRGRPVHVSIDAVDGDVELRIRDEGVGIERKDVERIFLRFERAVSTRHYGGLGLGLYVARQLVEAHSGTIRVESQPGKGASFVVRLPRAPYGVARARGRSAVRARG